ncbi:MAG: hypothetical protein AAB732_01550 [Patescibacteria group bacterium]
MENLNPNPKDFQISVSDTEEELHGDEGKVRDKEELTIGELIKLGNEKKETGELFEAVKLYELAGADKKLIQLGNECTRKSEENAPIFLSLIPVIIKAYEAVEGTEELVKLMEEFIKFGNKYKDFSPWHALRAYKIAKAKKELIKMGDEYKRKDKKITLCAFEIAAKLDIK